MEAYIKYKRIYGKFSSEELQKEFDELVSRGWDIIYYKESPAVTEKKDNDDPYDFSLSVVMVVGKRQSNVI